MPAEDWAEIGEIYPFTWVKWVTASRRRLSHGPLWISVLCKGPVRPSTTMLFQTMRTARALLNIQILPQNSPRNVTNQKQIARLHVLRMRRRVNLRSDGRDSTERELSSGVSVVRSRLCGEGFFSVRPTLWDILWLVVISRRWSCQWRIGYC